MATLRVTINEQINLNNQEYGGMNELSISSINEIFKRIVTVSTNELVLYETDDSLVAGAKFDDDNIKYVRIKNLDTGSNYIVVRVKNAANDEFAYKLNAGEMFLLYQHEGTMNAVAAGTLDIGTGWEDITSVKLTSSSGSQDAEVFIAST